jgi:hypothetical protein
LFEENGPVVFVRIDDGTNERASIGHIDTDVKKIFEEPEKREDEAVGLAVVEEKSGAEEWNEKFAKRAAEKHQGVPEITEQRMTGFVNYQVDVVEDQEAGFVAPGIEEEEEIEGEDDAAAQVRDTGPVSGTMGR